MNAVTSQRTARKTAPGPEAGHARSFAFRRLALTLLLVAACLAAGGTHDTYAATSLVHKRAPEFVRTDLGHKRLDLNAYRGKVVLLDFWATWCAPCQVEMPSFVDWQKKYGPRGLQVIGISLDDDPVLVRSLVGKLKLNYPVAMGDVKLGDLYGGVLGLPVTYLIDRHGMIQAEFQGEADLGKIERQMQSLLSGR